MGRPSVMDGFPIGILIPTRNRLGYLKEALASSLGQTCPDLHVVVIDNASTDGTREFMASPRDPRVYYIPNESDIGIAGSIDKGIGAMPSAVKWCTVLGDDDQLDPGFIESMKRVVIFRSARSVVHGHRVFIDADGHRIGVALPSPVEESGEEFLRNRLYSRRMTYLTGVLFHRRVFGELGGYPKFPTGLATDDALIFSLALTDRLVYAPDAVALVRIHPEAESQSSGNLPEIVASMKAFREYCVEVFGKARGKRSKEVERLLAQYVHLINSAMFLRRLHSLLETGGPAQREELESLCAYVDGHGAEFSRRARFAALFGPRPAICPERYPVYRFLWFLAGPSWRSRWRLHLLQKAASRSETRVQTD